MSTWPNRGASGGPCGGLQERKIEPKTVRPRRPDSSQQASSKPGAVQPRSVVAGRLDDGVGVVITLGQYGPEPRFGALGLD